MGGLTSPPVLSIGSSAGQVPEASAAQTNLCADGYNIGFVWTNEGAPVQNTVPQFDNGFVPVGLQTPNGATSRMKSAAVNLYTVTSIPALATDRVNCFSVYVQAWQGVNPSPQCRFEATLAPSGKVVSLTLNPINGVLIGQLGNPTSVAVERIVSPLIAKVENVPLYRISFALDVGTDTTAVLRCYPRTDGLPAGVTIFGGAQVEGQVSHPTPFISHGARGAGAGPRQVSTPNLMQRVLNATPYQVDPIADQDTWLQCNLLAGNTVTLPTTGTVLPDMPAGSRLLITQSATAIGGVTTVQAAPNSILAPGGITPTFTNLTFPSTDFPNVTQMLLIKTDVLNQWMILSTSAGGSGGGLFLQPQAGAVPRSFQSKATDVISVLDFGAVADGKYIADATIALGTPTTLTSASNPFTAADVGKRILIWGAGTGINSLAAIIQVFNNAGSVTLNTAASTAVTNVAAHWGTDNHAAFLAAAAAAYLVKGTLTAKGCYFVYYGAMGDEDGSHDVSIPDCSNVTYDWAGLTFLGTIAYNVSIGAGTPKSLDFIAIGGTFRGVGNRVEAPSNSTSWNMVTCVYAERGRIVWPSIHVPAGARAISFQSANTVGTDTIKLKDMFAQVLIDGPTDPALQYLSDGVDCLTAGADQILDGISVSGIVRNTGRGLITQNSGTFKNRNLSFNLQIINPRQVGSIIFDVDGLDRNITIERLNPDAAGTYTYLGRGHVENNCTRLGAGGHVHVIGENVATLGVAIALGGTVAGVNSRNNDNLKVTTINTANKFTTGVLLQLTDNVAANITVENCAVGLNTVNNNDTGILRGFTARGCTADLGANALAAIGNSFVTLTDYVSFPNAGTGLRPSINNNYITGRKKYSTAPIGVTAYGATGADVVHVNGSLYEAEIFIPRNMILTGIGLLNGTLVGTNSLIVALYNNIGILVANSALAGVASAGANSFQQIPFTAAYTAFGPGSYYIAIQSNGGVDTIRCIAANTFIDCDCQIDAGVFGTLPNISPPASFAANTGPFAYVY